MKTLLKKMSPALLRINRHSIHIILALLIGVLAGSIGVGILVQQNPYIIGVDKWSYGVINGLPHNSVIDLLIRPITYNFLPTIVPSFFYFLWGGSIIYLAFKDRKTIPWLIFCLILGTFISGFITDLDWKFVFRERPFESLPSTMDESARAGLRSWSSYPSGHTRETALYSLIIAYFIPKLKVLAILFISLIAFTRVYIGAHYPTDVIAGGIIGTVTAKVTLIIAEEAKEIIKNLKGRYSKGKHAHLN